MKAGSHCMPKACPEASSAVQLVQIEASLSHPCVETAQQAGRSGPRSGLGPGRDDFALGQNTSSLYPGQSRLIVVVGVLSLVKKCFLAVFVDLFLVQVESAWSYGTLEG
jgi:hypothetical protein